MKDKTIKILTVLLIVLVIILIIILGVITGKMLYNKQMIKKVSTIYIANIDIQKEKVKDKNSIIKIDGNNVVGILKIDKINFEGLVYEGINTNILKNGVGHFDNSPIFNGNACFAAHNYWNYWSKLHKLKAGDNIEYISYLGRREYQVCKVQEIDDTDWSLLKNTEENQITLITCIKNKPEKRLCVQGKEKF